MSDLRASLAGFVFDEEVEKAKQELLRDRYIHTLDPDLEANKSFSLATKQRIMIDRLAVRRASNSKHWMVRAIEDAMKERRA